MRVAVFALFSDAERNCEGDLWLQYLLQALAQEDSISHLVLYTNKVFAEGLYGGKLVTQVVEQPIFFWSRWRQHRVWRRQLQQQNITSILFFGLQSIFKVSLPSYFLLQPADINRNRILRKQINRAAFEHVFVASNAAMHQVTRIIGSQAAKISVVHGAPPVRSLTEADPQLVKDRFTDGAEYFLYYGSLDDNDSVILLLKAFSRFKHRQKSSWKLVLAPKVSPGKLEVLLSRYKYRQDVVLVPQPGAETTEALYAAAYCFVQPAAPGYFGLQVMRSLSWGLPIIATSGCRDWAGSAALYFEQGDEEQLATHLMALYKDEALRQRLAEAATQRAASLSWHPLVGTIFNAGQPAV